MKNNNEAKIARAKNWFFKLSDEDKQIVVDRLFEFALDSEWINLWSEEDKEDFLEEGMPLEQWEAPYIRSCGIPLNMRG